MLIFRSAVIIQLLLSVHNTEERPSLENTTIKNISYEAGSYTKKNKQKSAGLIKQPKRIADVHGRPKIISRESVSVGEIPYQVSLRRASGHMCGGAIINPNTILTAAHCFFPKAQKDEVFFIVAGSLEVNDWVGEHLEIETIHIHPDYVFKEPPNDIAVAILTEELVFSDTIQPICIVKLAPTLGDNCTVSGWGLTNIEDSSGKREGSDFLKKATVIIQSSDGCSYNYTRINDIYATEAMLCASGNGTDSCQGDSGGPLVCGEKLAGIVSWGYKCGHVFFPGVYTNVSFYRDWIQKAVNSTTQLNYNINMPILYYIFSYSLVLLYLLLYK